jgi:hypothetical protein
MQVKFGQILAAGGVGPREDGDKRIVEKCAADWITQCAQGETARWRQRARQGGNRAMRVRA